MPETPLVSCLMVTRPAPDRLARAELSVGDYLRQTFPARELVVVLDPRADRAAVQVLKARLASLARPDIRLVEPPDVSSLGMLRNASLTAARGDLLCIWDDDDRHHPERIARQAAALAESGAAGLCLQHIAHYFAQERRLYVTNWIKTDATGLPSSLLVRRDSGITYPETGPDADLGEDMVPLRQLQAAGGLALLADAPHLYVYVFHGGNSWGAAHHRRLATELGLSEGLLRRREAALRAGLAAFDFGPEPIRIQGHAGAAFAL